MGSCASNCRGCHPVVWGSEPAPHCTPLAGCPCCVASAPYLGTAFYHTRQGGVGMVQGFRASSVREKHHTFCRLQEEVSGRELPFGFCNS